MNTPSGEQLSTAPRLLVKPRPGVSPAALEELLRSHGARRVGVIRQIDVHVVELPPQANVREVAEKLRQSPHIEFVEIDEKLPPARP